MLEVRGLSKVFGRESDVRVTALDDVDLQVAEGELVTVLGPSGCGKTTLLRAIAGFETPDNGSITVAGRQVAGPGRRVVPAHQRGIGLVPQEGALFPHLSVAQNVGFGLRHLGGRERRARVRDALELVDLGQLSRRRPHELSGGQQQRVSLARAIAPGPRVVLLDEPFSALDEYLRESLREQVQSVLTALGTTAVLVTHDQQEALALGDRVAVMRAGRMVQVDDPRTTYFRPLDLQLARFLGEAVVVEGEILPAAQLDPSMSPRVTCVFGTLPVADWHGRDGRCEVLIRPENIQASRAEGRLVNAAAEGCGGLVGTILTHTFYGHDEVLHVQVPELAQHIPVRVLGDHDYRVGDHVRLVVERPVCTYSS
ncbi:MAG: ABC transporter ATP-binding protein [Intrasporangium sp.]|uniref:ABC transporter ATP-binding protein n=1 Tax=Intrasporangium sp. TaxID=1925024 RepID=UPI002648FE23|nr:ABC transporter ATP-binding protein [Intrasporangium sp.]MDN5796508.1 ABC transporter ATP-binding protein [Intrasporangium sp.]